MFCNNCGNQLENDVKFCSNCGRETTPSAIQIKPQTTAHKKTSWRDKRIGCIPGCLIVLLSIFVFIGLAVWVSNTINPKNEKTTTVSTNDPRKQDKDFKTFYEKIERWMHNLDDNHADLQKALASSKNVSLKQTYDSLCEVSTNNRAILVHLSLVKAPGDLDDKTAKMVESGLDNIKEGLVARIQAIDLLIKAVGENTYSPSIEAEAEAKFKMANNLMVFGLKQISAVHNEIKTNRM